VALTTSSLGLRDSTPCPCARQRAGPSWACRAVVWPVATTFRLPTYKHTYIHTYVHTYIREYIHISKYIRTHTYVHTYLHTYVHTAVSFAEVFYIACPTSDQSSICAMGRMPWKRLWVFKRCWVATLSSVCVCVCHPHTFISVFITAKYLSFLYPFLNIRDHVHTRIK